MLMEVCECKENSSKLVSLSKYLVHHLQTMLTTSYPSGICNFVFSLQTSPSTETVDICDMILEDNIDLCDVNKLLEVLNVKKQKLEGVYC